MHLVVDAGVSHLNFEGTLVSPGAVPGVNSEPVVLAVLVSPSDNLDGMTTEGTTGCVGVNTTLVSEEVLVDGEGSSHGTVAENVVLDLVDNASGTEAVAR